MVYQVARPQNESYICESTTSIASAPVAASAIAAVTGYVERVMAAAGGTTTGTITVAVSINGGSDIAGGALTIAAGTGARGGSILEFQLLGAGAVHISEADQITFTPSGGTGSNIPGAFALVIRKL